jgi:hypothetical protein
MPNTIGRYVVSSYRIGDWVTYLVEGGFCPRCQEGLLEGAVGDRFLICDTHRWSHSFTCFEERPIALLAASNGDLS